MKDLKLNTTSHDIEIENYDMSFVEGIDFIMQNIKIKLLTLHGEWFLDTNAGVKYFEEIMVKNPSVPSIDTIIQSEILDSYGVNKILEYTSDFISRTRKLNISFKIDTIEGEGTFSGEIP